MGYYKQEFEGNEMVGATCDNCGTDWEHWNEGWTLMPDENSLWQELDSCGWCSGEHEGHEKGTLYCDECWSTDEHDNFRLKTFI